MPANAVWHRIPGGTVLHRFVFVPVGMQGEPMQVCTGRVFDRWALGNPPEEKPRCWRCEHRPHPKALEYLT